MPRRTREELIEECKRIAGRAANFVGVDRGSTDSVEIPESPGWDVAWSDESADPLDVEYDGVRLRSLLGRDQHNRRDDMYHQFSMTPIQRSAVSAHWSAELRKRVEAAKERERRQVVLDE